MLRRTENGLRFTREGEVLQLEPYGPNVIRVRAASARLSEERWTLLPPREADWIVVPCGTAAQNRENAEQSTESAGRTENADISDRSSEKIPDSHTANIAAAHFPEGAALVNGKLRAEITADGRITFRREDGRLLLKEYWMDERDQPSRILRNQPGGLAFMSESFRPQQGEHFYGMGQEAHDLFDLKGSTLDICHQNTKSTIPFVLSSRGYGFLWNNPAIGRVEFGTSRTRWVAERTLQMDYLVIAGDCPDEIERTYAALTGYAPVLPMWATGLWQSKLRYETQDELMEVAREYQRRGIPISMIVCDYFHWPQQGEWKFDRRYWPDPEGMVRELSEMGVKLLVSVWPTVDPRSENYVAMKEENMLIRTERGPGPLVYCRGPETYVDVMNPEARDFFWDRVRENYYALGVRNFWLDEAEPEIGPYDYDNLRYFLGNGMEVSGLYPFYYAKTFYDGQQREGPEEIVNLIRCAFLGSQRFGTVLWSGDIMTDFDSLRRQIKTGLHVAVSGIPWWTTDIGGFHGGDHESPEYRELMVRWFQFGAFCPIFRMHGFRKKADRPAVYPYSMDSACYSGGPNEIWSYGEEVYEILKKYVGIREEMRPYIYENLKKASETGTPMMRPLFYDFPEERCYDIFDQYMFGPDLMVCPVYEYGRRERDVYLPAGAVWENTETGERFDGGIVVKVPAPLDTMPVFRRC